MLKKTCPSMKFSAAMMSRIPNMNHNVKENCNLSLSFRNIISHIKKKRQDTVRLNISTVETESYNSETIVKPQASPRNRPPSIHPLNHWEFLTFQVEVEGPQTWPEKGEVISHGKIHGNVKHLPTNGQSLGRLVGLSWDLTGLRFPKYKNFEGNFETSQKTQENV